MVSPLQKVQTGQKLEIPAETFNTFIDAAQDFKARQQSRGGRSTPHFPNSGVVKIRNESGADRDRFDVLGLATPIIDPSDNLSAFKNEPTFIGVATTGEHRGRFAILLEPVRAGAIAHYACVSGVTAARIYVQREWHDRADVSPGSSYLASNQTGAAKILWKEPGLGVRWALVRLGLGYEEGFWARIISAESIGPHQWKYAFYEVEHADDKLQYGAWTPMPGGRVGFAYNVVEDANDGRGVEGNGVDIDALKKCCSSGTSPCECRLLPVGKNAIVRMREAPFGAGPSPIVEYWFQYENEATCCPEAGSSSSSGSHSSFSSSGSSSGSGSSSESSGASSGSGSTDNSSSGSADGSSASDGSDGGGSSDQSGGPCEGFSGTITVGDGQLQRSGDTICEGTKQLTFQNGLLCSVSDGSPSCAYVCCDSSSSAAPPSLDSSSDSSSNSSGGNSSSRSSSTESSDASASRSDSTSSSESSPPPSSESEGSGSTSTASDSSDASESPSASSGGGSDGGSDGDGSASSQGDASESDASSSASSSRPSASSTGGSDASSRSCGSCSNPVDYGADGEVCAGSTFTDQMREFGDAEMQGTVTWELASGPSGMTVSESGAVEWGVP